LFVFSEQLRYVCTPNSGKALKKLILKKQKCCKKKYLKNVFASQKYSSIFALAFGGDSPHNFLKCQEKSSLK
jgi:hypothetical protein